MVDSSLKISYFKAKRQTCEELGEERQWRWLDVRVPKRAVLTPYVPQSNVRNLPSAKNSQFCAQLLGSNWPNTKISFFVFCFFILSAGKQEAAKARINVQVN